MPDPLNSPEKRKTFSSFVSNFITKPYDKIVLVDHSHTGMSVLNLIKLFQVSGIDSKFDFVNLVDTKTPLWLIKNPYDCYLQQYHVLRGDFINDVSGHIIPRLCPQHHLINILNQKQINQKSIEQGQRLAEAMFSE